MRLGAVSFFLAALCSAQTTPDKPPETTFRVGTDLVLLNVSVFDAAGKILKGLPQSAFTVYENNVKQDITVFRQEDVPVSLGLLIDNSASMANKKDRVVSASIAMVKASNPDDEVFVIKFSENADVVQDFTNDIATLEKTLNTSKTQGETAMRDAVLLAIDHLRAKAKRDKRVLVIITDGEDNSSVSTQQRVVEAAHQSNVIVYAIALLGEEQPASAARARSQLDALTVATGGRSWYPANVGDIAGITPEIAHEIRNQYVLGYTPADLTKDGKFRTIRVEVNVPGATVRTRSGYYARP
ncbi:MAG TPA: VWA domain-containing protein [Candidatus Limnocylindrales bacterium]|nr:VWA domain-containing protein [Candidatus Limnocylindrales bacterium]